MPAVSWEAGKPPAYLRKRGKQLAAANIKCRGTPNKHGEFYRCVKNALKQ